MKIIKSEIAGKRLRLKITDFSNSTDFDTEDLFSLSNGMMDLEITNDSSDYSLPWDAGFAIKGNDVILEGSAGDNGFGSCIVKVPKNKAAKVYGFELGFDEDIKEEVIEFLTSHKVNYK